jgi:predicted dehydrogenase
MAISGPKVSSRVTSISPVTPAITVGGKKQPQSPAGATGSAPIVPITNFAGKALDVPAGGEPLAAAAEHFVDCIRNGEEPLTSGRRSLRVVEALERADRAARSGSHA